MAESSAPGDLRNVELQSFTSSRGSQVHYVRGKHLSKDEVCSTLFRNVTQLNDSGRKMLETLHNMESHDFHLIQQEFPVSYLQHVTDRDSMDNICNQEGFRIMKQTSRPGFSDLSFWSAGIASADVEAARENSYEDYRQVLPLWAADKYEERIKAQYANSPAFNASASRYGNFKFSFPLSSLLDLYQTQHCRGEEPQLRVLGTDIYKQEVAHYVLVHSPDKSSQFQNLPTVPTVQSDCESLPLVYRKGGRLYWRPESTSSILTVKISEQGVARRECPIPCPYFNDKGYCVHMKESSYEIWSMWNHLVLAFHLPDRLCLKVSKEQLLKKLTACDIDEPALLEESKCLPIEEAEDLVQEMKSDFGKKRMRTS